MDLRNIKDGTSYQVLMNSVNAKILFFDDLKKFDASNDKGFVIRHDVDDVARYDKKESMRELKNAVDMARMERKMGIKSTYFLLHSAKYFDYSNLFKNRAKMIVKNGHHIGLHNDVIGEYLKCGRKKSMQDIINEPLNFLRKNGIEVNGVSSHGNLLCGQAGVSNAIWKGIRVFGKPIPAELERITLSDVGLKYDVVEYYPRNDKRYYFLGDGSGRWNGVSPDIFVFPKPEVRLKKSLALGKKIIDKFNGTANGVLHMLIHPRWWRA